ncbi:MAG TPA: diphthine synthase [Candidatus Nitrosopolaris sp.]|nr:diphthine synthase [Candidatus Nitrosopolaris sp.]
MLRFIGLGINGYKSMSIHVLEILRNCDAIYLDKFTGFVSDDDLKGLKSLAELHDFQINILAAERWFVEDGRDILEQARRSDVVLLTYGDPFIATTLIELYVRAVKSSTKVDVIHAASGITSLIGEAGLHLYKFGRMVTLTSEPLSSVSVYNTISENLLGRNHTLILTEYNGEHKKLFFLDPNSAFRTLLQAEKDYGFKVFFEDTFAVVASRIGMPDQKIVSGKVKSLNGIQFGQGPHSIIITGSLHFTEVEALMTLTHNLNEPVDNTANIQNLSAIMIARYAPQARQTLSKLKCISSIESGISGNKIDMEILANAECYIDDAERFLGQGKPELAVLSIGYAEGLIDGMRLKKGFEP